MVFHSIFQLVFFFNMSYILCDRDILLFKCYTIAVGSIGTKHVPHKATIRKYSYIMIACFPIWKCGKVRL